MFFIFFENYSQGNLQFNRVINLEYTKVLAGTTSSAGDTGETLLETISVPENKVWKIVSSSITCGDRIRNNNPLYDSCNAVNVFINGTKVISNRNYNGYNGVQLPIWINSGSKNINAYMVDSDTDPYWISLSIIEFNIVN